MPDTYVALDLETTGLSPKLDKIIEIGAVHVEDGKVTDTFSSFVNPGRELDKSIIELTGITQEQVDGAPEIKDLIALLIDFIGDCNLLGHRILFDYSFVKKAAVNNGLLFEKKGVDTLKLSRMYLPELPSKKLPDLCRHFGISQNAHRALEDAMAAHLLYEKLKEKFYEEESFRPHSLQYKVKKEAVAGRRQQERLQQLAARHGLHISADIEKMTKNEVSRLTDQILAEYGR